VGDGQAQSDARIPAGRAALDLKEWLEDTRDLIRRNADAGIDDRDADGVAITLGASAPSAPRLDGRVHRAPRALSQRAVIEDGCVTSVGCFNIG